MGVNSMSLLKIILFSVRLAISIFTGAMTFILGNTITNAAFGFVSGILFIAFVLLTWSAVFISHDMPLTARILIPSLALFSSYITSPFSGLLKYLKLMIERIEGFNGFLKAI
jgi:hypothetical protein